MMLQRAAYILDKVMHSKVIVIRINSNFFVSLFVRKCNVFFCEMMFFQIIV